MSKVDEAYNRLESWSLTFKNHVKDRRKEIRDILDGKVPLSDGCPSRAAAAWMGMDQVLQDRDEIVDALKSLDKAIGEEGG
jgi:hypothetical protein